MPVSLYAIINTSHKKLKLAALIILSPLFFYGQTLTGLWTGALSNDSNTVRKDQSFEIALTEYKGKVYGYSRSEFIVDDILYFVVKRVKGTIDGDVCEVKDDEIIAYNFPSKLDKGVKVTSTFRRNKNDSAWYLDGTWKTNQTKNYYAVTGKVKLEEEKDLGASKIFPHLEELKLAGEVAFYKERKEGPPIVKIARPEKNSNNISARVEALTREKETSTEKPVIQKAEPSIVAVVPATDEKMPDPIVANTVIKEGTVIPSLATETKSTVANNLPINSPSTPVVIKNKPETEPAVDNPSETAVVKTQAEKTTKTDADAIVSPVHNSNTVKNTSTETAPTKKENIPTVSAGKPQENAIAKNTAPKTLPVTDKNYVAPPGEDIPRDVFVKKPIVNTTANTEPKKEPVVAKNTNPKQPAKNSPVVISVPVIVPNKTIETNENWNEQVTIPEIPPVKTSVAERKGAAESINARKTEVSQVVNFKSDSLLLALYDNGQIDGDTVSVLMNGELILAKQGLKASAIRKTVYITPGKDDEFTLVLYAENLGAYPPNTGLLVVRDGDDVYNLRFSSDFQKNAAIVFRKRK